MAATPRSSRSRTPRRTLRWAAAVRAARCPRSRCAKASSPRSSRPSPRSPKSSTLRTIRREKTPSTNFGLQVDKGGTVPGILAYGSYVPYWRLQRAAIGAALGSGGGKGTRAVASFDEDTTSMAVEAGRLAMASAPDGLTSAGVLFSTTNPPYLDKTNATAIHAALGFDTVDPAFDVVGSVRSAFAAVGMARHGGGTPRL